MADRRPIRLPRQWPEHVKSGILHAISLASVVLSHARGRATSRRRLRAQLEHRLAVSYVDGRRYLPVIELRRAA